MKAMEILKEFLRIINEEGIDWQELCEQTDLLEIYVVPSLQNLKDLESYIEERIRDSQPTARFRNSETVQAECRGAREAYTDILQKIKGEKC